MSKTTQYRAPRSTSTSSVISARDALKYLGVIITMVGGIGLLIVGAKVGEQIAANTIYQLSYGMILAFAIIILVFGLMALFRNRLPVKINIGWYSILILPILIILMLIDLENKQDVADLQLWNGIAISGVLITFYALRPNFGPEANKRIYQAAAGIFAFLIGIIMFILGLYVRYLLDISQFAGRGTYPGEECTTADWFSNVCKPGDDFVYTYIETLVGGRAITTYKNMIGSGEILMWCSALMIIASLFRNKIGLLLSAIIIFSANIGYLVGVALFRTYWRELDEIFYEFDEYQTQLTIIEKDPGVFALGMVLVFLQVVAFLLMLYASFAAKPIEQWRRKRDHSIAAAEVATREGRLPQAVKYLEAAAMWSSKIDEEDKSIELLTRVKQIKDKAIKMRKAQAAQKAKKDYSKQQRAEQRSKERPAPKKKIPKAKPTPKPKGKPAPKPKAKPKAKKV
jgi:hypothetical protein